VISPAKISILAKDSEKKKANTASTKARVKEYRNGRKSHAKPTARTASTIATGERKYSETVTTAINRKKISPLARLL
jgi:hypothetical protein